MLLRESRPLTRAQIMERSGAYGDDPERGRATFERDKRALRELGVPISTVIAEGDEGATRYTVETDDYDLPPLALEPDEHLALVMATAMVDLDRRWDDVALRKLGGGEVAGAGVRAALPALDALPGLQQAVAARAPARFTYNGRDRDVAARALVFRSGRWYLIADEGEARKTFRVDRIQGTVDLGDEGSVPEVEGDPVDALTVDPMLLERDDEVTARVLVEGHHAPREARRAGVEVVEQTEGGAVLAIRVINRDAFRTWVVGLGTAAEVLEPPELRDEMVSWLRAVAR